MTRYQFFTVRPPFMNCYKTSCIYVTYLGCTVTKSLPLCYSRLYTLGLLGHSSCQLKLLEVCLSAFRRFDCKVSFSLVKFSYFWKKTQVVLQRGQLRNKHLCSLQWQEYVSLVFKYSTSLKCGKITSAFQFITRSFESFYQAFGINELCCHLTGLNL